MEIKVKNREGEELTFTSVVEAAKWGTKEIQKAKNRLQQMRKEKKELKAYINYIETTLGFKRKREKRKIQQKEETKEAEKVEIETEKL